MDKKISSSSASPASATVPPKENWSDAEDDIFPPPFPFRSTDETIVATGGRRETLIKSASIIEELVFPDDTIRRRKLILDIDRENEPTNYIPQKSTHFVDTAGGEIEFVPTESAVPENEEEPPRLREKTHSVFIHRRVRHEPWYHIHAEVAIPFLIAGVGMVVAGYLLDVFSCYPAFLHIRELVVLITPLLGLKGTLEMTLAARLCTHVNLGHMDSCKKRIKAAIDDMLLSQVQGILCGLFAAVLAIILVKLESTDEIHAPLFNRLIVVWAIAILTAMTASFIIGSIVVLIVFSSDKCNVNPDNIATPIIACLGDVLTLVLLSGWGHTFYEYLAHSKPDDPVSKVAVPLTVVALTLMVILPIMLFISLKDKSSRAILKNCWLPVITGIIISTAAGNILEREGMRYINMNFYQPVINFVGGNLASIQYNRISTAYCRDAELGTLPKLSHGLRNKVCPNPYSAACTQGQHSTSALVLMSLVIPSQINFAMLTYFLIPSHVPDCFATYLLAYLFAGVVQTAFLMYITLLLTNYLWSRKHDPDSYVIPFVTATSDLIGTSFLFFVCYLVYGTNESCKAGYDPNSLGHGHCAHTD